MTGSGIKKGGDRPGGGMTPLMHQYFDIKRQHADALVLFRMGDFYETFDDDAKKASKILGITLTKRANGAAADVPLAGFPHHALDSYLPKLTEAGLRVAICEQVEDPKLAKGLVRREVVEVVTPGTAFSESYPDQKTNNFLGGIAYGRDRVGFAFLDHSTGEFYVGESSGNDIGETLAKFSPREMIVQEDLKFQEKEWVKKNRPFITEMDVWAFDYGASREALLNHFGTTSLQGFGCDQFTAGISAAGVILRYVERNIRGSLDHVTKLTPIADDGVMGLDEFTIRNLELFNSLATQGTHGTLMGVLDQTVTPGGGRLLRQWLNRPLTDRSRIEARLACVEGFVTDPQARGKVRRELALACDMERVVGKLSRGRGTPRDVASLRNTLSLVPVLRQLLADSESSALRGLSRRLDDTSGIAADMGDTLVESPPPSLADGGVVRDGIDDELDELRTIARGGKDWIANLERTERKRSGIPSLKIGYNRVFGYYLEVTKAHLGEVPDAYIRKQTLVNAERFATPELKEYEEKILNAEEKILKIETRIFQELRSRILADAARIQTNASVFNRADVFATLAEVAVRNRYVKPILAENPVIDLSDARHAVVETLLPAGEKFVPNDLHVAADGDQILLITGPNMAGKSTYLRQVGLIVVMAQMGCYVPAREATVGIVDRLFTRVGASDNLAGGESTFLVEMTEAANILNNATYRSLVLFDEIGRGTATFDGLSLAWAITEFLHDTASSAARTLFATHYHELTELEYLLERVKNYNVAVQDFGDRIAFLRKIVPGPCDKSYGIHVAQMAGVPKSVVVRAMEILSHLVKHESLQIDGTHQWGAAWNQMTLFSEKESKLRQVLSEIDIDGLTPLEALDKLHELKTEYGL